MTTAPDQFIVIIHDVAAPFLAPLATLISRLAPLVGRALAGAVVPRWHGLPPPEPAGELARLARESFGELLLHGLNHSYAGPPHPVALLTAGANEFSGLAPAAAIERLRRGQRDMAALFGGQATGFVPPAWQSGRLTPATLGACGLRYCAGMFALRTATSGHVPLATWSWDCGRMAALGFLGEALGDARRAARRGAVPCVVLHPSDVARGFLPRAAALVERLIAAGLSPALPAEIASRAAECAR